MTRFLCTTAVVLGLALTGTAEASHGSRGGSHGGHHSGGHGGKVGPGKFKPGRYGKRGVRWTRKYWDRGRGCWLYWCPDDSCWYSYSEDDDCYYPID